MQKKTINYLIAGMVWGMVCALLLIFGSMVPTKYALETSRSVAMLLGNPSLTLTEENDPLAQIKPSYNASSGRWYEIVRPVQEINPAELFTTARLDAAFGSAWELARPLYIEKFPDDFSAQGDSLLFTRSLLPLILRENKKIQQERDFLLSLENKDKSGQTWTPVEMAQFETLLRQYGVVQEKVPAVQLVELLKRVDVIPPSLALAQAAVQTNWGKKSVQNPFGQYAWVNGKYVEKPFVSLAQSVHDYMVELNTLPLYDLMRRQRQSAKETGGVNGVILADEMRLYMPQNPAYVSQLKQAIRYNNLTVLDKAILNE